MKRIVSCVFPLIVFLNNISAQTIAITGRVTSKDDRMPLPGVSVKVKNGKESTKTNSDGRYVLKIGIPGSTIEYSIIGFVKQEISVLTTSVLDVALESDLSVLNEVVVTGYTIEDKSKFTGSAGVVNSRQINQVPVGSFDQALQGRVAGTYITAGSGQPGSAARTIVRGIGTISGVTQPLYVIDGVPVEVTINYGVNPSDIESIYVLKDASSTALYGSRGANGVIIVNTKRGKQGSTQFGYKTQFGLATMTNNKYNMLSSSQRLQFEEEVGLDASRTIGPGWRFSPNNPANLGISETQKLRNAAILDSLRNINTDWVDHFFRNGKFQEHDISASGGNDKIRFYSSANYYDQEGIGIRSYLKRYSFRTNLDFNQDRLTANLSLGLGLTKTSGIEDESTSSSFNSFAAVYYALPYEQPYINGTLYHTGNRAQAPNTIYDQREGSTALERLQDATSASDLIKSVISGTLNYKLNDYLSASTAFGLDFRDLNFIRTILSGTYFGSLQKGKEGMYYDQVNRNLQYVSTTGLAFNRNYNSKHDISARVLFEVNRLHYKSTNFTGYGINPKFNGTPSGVTSVTPPTVGGSRTENALVSFIGIAKHTYNRRYTTNLSYRYDGSSIVSEKNRWTGFYSLGFTWNAKEEDFLKDFSSIDQLRFRSSYGKTSAPFSTDNFSYVSSYETSKYVNVGTVATSPGNSDYDWEISNQLDLGVDFSILGQRLRGTFDFYNKVTSDIFVEQQLAAESGFPVLRLNTGRMRNRGIEGEISWELISNRDWHFVAGGNFGYNKNKVLDLGGINEFIVGTTIVREGLPYGTQYAVRWAGVDPKNGNALYYNRDGTTTNEYNATTQSVALNGSFHPPFQGGFFSAIKYRNLQVDALFSYTNGYYRLNNEDLYNENPNYSTSNQSSAILRRWREEGDITDVQRYDIANPRRLSSKDVQDASYIRFRNLRVGYSLPHSFLNKIKLKEVRLYMQAQNLYTWTKWTGFDPEDNNNVATFEYPTPRTYTLGLNVNF